MRIIMLIMAFLIVIPPAAYAQNALSYTTKGSRSSTNNHSGNMRRTTIMNDMNPAESAEPAENAKIENGEDVPEDPVKRVWRKYKAMASGEPDNIEQEENSDTPQKPKRPKSPRSVKTIKADPGPEIPKAAPKAASKTPPPTGFAAIIQQYHKTKEERRGMRAITVNPPKSPQKPDLPEITDPANEN